MKIGIVTTMDVLPWAGSEELWDRCAHDFLAQGHEVHVYYPVNRGWASQMQKLLESGACIHPYGLKPGSIFRIARTLYRHVAGTLKASLFPVDEAWKSMDMILLSQGSCYDGHAWLEQLYANRSPYVILAQANMDCFWPSDELAEKMDLFYKSARRVFFVSKDNEALFRLQTGYNDSNTSFAWNPVQPETPREPLPWPLEEDKWRLAMVGRIEPFAKGQDLLLDVMSRAHWRARDISVTIYGSGPWMKTAEKIVRQRNLSRVSFGGFRTPAEIWKTHHLLVLPSRHEGMALAMLEALWLGRPVLATALAGAVSEIEDGINGFLCAAPTADLLNEALERAWLARHQWRTLGQAAARKIRDRMGPDPIHDFANQLLTLAK